MMLDPMLLMGGALLGTVLAAFLACIPALHIYNVAGILVILASRYRDAIPGELLAMFMLGLVVGYAMVNSVPSIFIGAPDDSTIFMVPAGQRYLLQRRGYEAAVLSGAGGLGGLFVLLAVAPLASRLLPLARTVIEPHLHWILGAISLFLLMSEWPKGSDRGRTGLARFLDGWRSLGAGLLTFLLSGSLGFILFYSSLVPVSMAFQNLLPVFVGLFGIPWLLQNIISQVRVPEQHVAHSVNLTVAQMARGVGAGALGGLFAAFFPIVTAGIGGFLAGHATSQRDDRLFIVSQGANKVIYYVGALLLLFVPGLHLTRGGMAWMLSGVYVPRDPSSYWLAVSAALLSGALAFLLLLPLSQGALWLVSRVDYRWLSAASLVLLLSIVVAFTGWGGLLITAVATGIGLLPAMWGTRRMNCLGVLLLPMTLKMSGLGSGVAAWLGLL
jgi:putative membrane protein